MLLHKKKKSSESDNPQIAGNRSYVTTGIFTCGSCVNLKENRLVEQGCSHGPGNVPVVARQTGTRQQCTPGGSPFSVLWDEHGGKIDGNDKENVFDRPPHRVKR